MRLAVISLDAAVAVLTNEWDHFEQHQMFPSKERVFFLFTPDRIKQE